MKYTISYTTSLALFFFVGAFVATASATTAYEKPASTFDNGPLLSYLSMYEC